MIIDVIINQANPEFLEPYIATARQKFDKNKKDSRDQSNKQASRNGGRKKRGSQSVHESRVLVQQKRWAREKDKR